MWGFVMVFAGALLLGRLPSYQALHQPSPESLSSISSVALFHDLWHWRTQESPEFASQVGINDNTAGRLDSFSKLRFQRRKEYCEKLLKRIEDVSKSNMTFEDQINLQTLKEQIQNILNNFQYIRHFVPVTSYSGPHIHLQHLVRNQMSLESYNDFQKLLARYGEFPRQVDEIMELMEDNIESGIMPHRLSMENIEDQFNSLNISLVDSIFFSPLLQIPLHIPPEQRRSLRQQAQERISQDLLPAFEKLKDYITDTYLKKTRTDPAISSVEDGSKYYAASLQFYTSTKLTPQQVHTLGSNEVKRLQTDLIKKTKEFGYLSNATLKEILEDIRQEKNYFTDGKQILEKFDSTVEGKIQDFLPATFKNLPLTNLTITDEPNGYTSRGRLAWYESPSLGGSRPGVLRLDTTNPRLMSKHEITPLCLHLANPGNHLHAVYLQTSSSVPSFRKIVNPSHWNLAPADFSHNPAFFEGWGLYSEHTGEEGGLYRTPMERLQKVARELTAASFLSVDTGIHAMGWSTDEAIDFLRDNTAVPEEMIHNHVKRIITRPGEACAAKVGEIKFKELRQRAENALGNSFNLDHFHDILLKCTSSLNVVQMCVTQYISEQIREHETKTTEEEEAMVNNEENINGNERRARDDKTIVKSSAQSHISFQYNTSDSNFISNIIFLLVYVKTAAFIWL